MRTIRPAMTLFGVLLAAALGGQTIGEHPLPTPASFPGDITLGPDGGLWFTESSGLGTPGTPNRIGHRSYSGVVTEFGVPSPNPGLTGIVAGREDVWFTERGANRIGRITLAGVVTEYPVPTPSATLGFIAKAYDHSLWFTEGIGKIGRITPEGEITEFPVPTAGAVPVGIAAGPDGNMWYADAIGRIGRITPAGVITEFALPPNPYGPGGPFGITAGADGNMWFSNGGSIGKISLAGAATVYPLGLGISTWGIARGPDGNVWYTATSDVDSTAWIGRITPAGEVTDFPIPAGDDADAVMITAGLDGALWFTQPGRNALGSITTGSSPCVPDLNSLCLRGGRLRATVEWDTPQAGPGIGNAVAMTPDTGYFWFFVPENVELVVKVLDGCYGPSPRYWVFAGGLTNAAVTLRVTDLSTGDVRVYDKPQGPAFPPIQDTSAFATCP